ncbi:SHOCT domain-containing protein [Pseudonocardia acidicola]|uniref:SHOCT domain-containing protein n=1 Tax=Pseudonocardia acidicola TaxID=2724939 RepID=A0ABX1S4D7_9PSEU|nr:SHOCT domain-containing protein [Pseudonocardia acidicola]NMH95762.1 SHOCT domain-containing protein [Pseudonocardia acidicola]
MTLWNILVSIFWFMLLFAWIWLLIVILSDIFRDHQLSGWAKALWTLFIIIIPWLGALVYLIARGPSMNERALAQAKANDQAFRQYVQQAAGAGTSTADELGKLADLRDRGSISQQDYEQAKAKVLGHQQPAAGAPPTDQQAAQTRT